MERIYKKESDASSGELLVMALVEYQGKSKTSRTGWTVREVWDGVMRSKEFPMAREGIMGSLNTCNTMGLKCRVQSVATHIFPDIGWRIVKARGYRKYNRETQSAHDVRYVCIPDHVNVEKYIKTMEMTWAPEGQYTEMAKRRRSRERVKAARVLNKSTAKYPATLRPSKPNGSDQDMIQLLEDALERLRVNRARSSNNDEDLLIIKGKVEAAGEGLISAYNVLREAASMLDEFLDS